MKEEKSCGCIIINDQNEVLLIHSNKGHWDFPKGHIEEGETEVETAKREVKEETNLKVEVIEEYRYTQRYSPKEDVIKEVVLFLGKNIGDNLKPQLEEVNEVRWFEYNKAIEKITYDNSREILIQLKKDLEKKGRM